MNYQTIKIEDIIAWCKANGQVEWLKATASQKVPCKVYPRIKSTNANGKVVSVVDKTAEPKEELRPITFIQIKQAFVEKFMPEIAPKAKEKKPSMYELISNL